MRISGYLAVLCLACLFAAQHLYAAISGTTQIASGLSSPLFATFAPGDANHLFVLEKGGNIKVVDIASKSVVSTFLHISDTDAADEGGLLGLAFNPDYAKVGSNGFSKFYVYVTVDNGGLPVTAGTAATATSPFSTHIRQYSVSSNPLVAGTSATEIMSWPRPEDNHVGGWIGFGPKDGYLYINSGDGGLANDSGAGHYEPGGNAQNITDDPNDFMGKQLRINVNSDAFPADPNRNYAIPATNPFVDVTGADEIWSYGLRNPFRSSFDRDTGDQWIADVGQDTREEIDFQPANSTGGENYGWRLREGFIATPTPSGSPVGGNKPSGNVDPVYDYTHGPGLLQGNAVIGGYVYRGPDQDEQGKYFFADEVSSHFWEMNTSTYAVTNIDAGLTPNTGSLAGPASFAEDMVGNQYIVSYGTGSVFQINTNNPLPGDYNADGTVNAADYVVWRKTIGTTAAYNVWRANFGQTVHISGLGSGSAVPEPAVACYLLEGCGWLSVALLFVRHRQTVTMTCV